MIIHCIVRVKYCVLKIKIEKNRKHKGCEIGGGSEEGRLRGFEECWLSFS